MNMTTRKKFPLIRYLLAGGAAGFLILLTLLVLKQAPALGDIGNRTTLFLGFMAADVAFVLLTAILSIGSNCRMQGFLTATAILAGIGSAYQFLFEHYSKHITMVAGALVVGTVVYLIMRHYSKLPDGWFYMLVGIIGALLAINVLFGVAPPHTGARLWVQIGPISFQPGEVVKVLLILLGALAFRNHTRSLIYCLMCLVSCGVLLLLNDMGNAVIIFGVFVLMTYLLFDNRLLSLSIIAGALVLFVIALQLIPHAARRIDQWTHAMTNTAYPQQREYITGVLLGGFRGLGLENAHHFTAVYSSHSDGALAGVMAVYGVPVVSIAIGAYAIVLAQPAYNCSVYPSNYLILSQITMLLFCQVMLNYCGALDLLPFTGVTAPLISAGGSSILCFGVLLGLQAASLNPKISIKEA